MQSPPSPRYYRNIFAALLVAFGLWQTSSAFAAGWVAVGENGTIIYSADGINWADAASGTGETLRGVFFDGAGTWVAAGQRGTIVNSQDAANWTQQASGNSDALWAATFKAGQWIVGGGGGRVVTSPDSISWTSVNGPFGFTLFDVAYDGSGLYAISGDSGLAPTMLVSTDTLTWNQRTPQPNNGEGLYGIGYAAGLWVAVGDKGTIITSTDPDSRSWSTQSSGTTSNLRDIVVDGSGRFVAVGEDGVILTSPDAITWTAQTSGTTEDLWGIEYDPAGLYVVVGFNATILTSTDAITWTPRTSPNFQRLRDVAIGKLPQEITFPTQDPLFQTFSVGETYPLNPQATASSGLPVTYTVLTPGTCSLNGTTVTMISAGECRVEASEPGDDTYLPAEPVSQSVLQIATPGPGLPTDPGLVFNPQDSEPFVSGGTFSLSPPASTTQTPVDPQPVIVYVSTTPSVCTIPFLGSIEVTMLAVGTCTITTASAPSSNYLLGGPLVDSIEILPLAQVITFDPQIPPSRPANDAPFPLTPAASASSGLPVSYTSLTPATCSITGSTVTPIAAGTCTIEASQAGDATYLPAVPVSQDIELLTVPPAPPLPVPILPLPLLVLLVLMTGLLGARYQRRA